MCLFQAFLFFNLVVFTVNWYWLNTISSFSYYFVPLQSCLISHLNCVPQHRRQQDESWYPDAAKCPAEMAVGSSEDVSVPLARKGQLGVSLHRLGWLRMPRVSGSQWVTDWTGALPLGLSQHASHKGCGHQKALCCTHAGETRRLWLYHLNGDTRYSPKIDAATWNLLLLMAKNETKGELENWFAFS